jgi:hypothetical protein
VCVQALSIPLLAARFAARSVAPGHKLPQRIGLVWAPTAETHEAPATRRGLCVCTASMPSSLAYDGYGHCSPGPAPNPANFALARGRTGQPAGAPIQAWTRSFAAASPRLPCGSTIQWPWWMPPGLGFRSSKYYYEQ